MNKIQYKAQTTASEGFMFNYIVNTKAILMNIQRDSLDDYIKQLKPKEILEDECVPTKYGMEDEAKQNGYKCKRNY